MKTMLDYMNKRRIIISEKYSIIIHIKLHNILHKELHKKRYDNQDENETERCIEEIHV